MFFTGKTVLRFVHAAVETIVVCQRRQLHRSPARSYPDPIEALHVYWSRPKTEGRYNWRYVVCVSKLCNVRRKCPTKSSEAYLPWSSELSQCRCCGAKARVTSQTPNFQGAARCHGVAGTVRLESRLSDSAVTLLSVSWHQPLSPLSAGSVN